MGGFCCGLYLFLSVSNRIGFSSKSDFCKELNMSFSNPMGFIGVGFLAVLLAVGVFLFYVSDEKKDKH